MANKPNLTIAGGTDTVSPRYTDNSASSTGYIETGVFDVDGQPYLRATGQKPPQGGRSGGDDPMIELAGLKKNVSFLNWAAALLLAAGVAGFFMLDDRILGVGRDVVEIKVQGARQNVILEQIAGKITDDEKPKPSQKKQ